MGIDREQIIRYLNEKIAECKAQREIQEAKLEVYRDMLTDVEKDK